MAASIPAKVLRGDAFEVGVVEFVQLQRDVEAILRGKLFDQPAHLAVPTMARSGMHSLVALEDFGVELGEEFVVQRCTVAGRSVSATTKLIFSSDAPCEIMRILMPSSELKTRRATPGV